MHILIGLILGLVLLYLWLVGHWFARVLVFLLTCTASIGLAAAIVSGIGWPPEDQVILALVLALMFGCIGWFVSSIPTYCSGRKARADNERWWEMKKRELLSQKPVGQPLRPASSYDRR